MDDKANSKWGRFKSDMAERAEAVTAPIADRWGRMKGRMGGKVAKASESAKSAGSMIGSGISAAGGFLKNMMGETVNEWQTFTTLWANFTPLSVKSVMEAQAAGYKTVARCVIRYRDGSVIDVVRQLA